MLAAVVELSLVAAVGIVTVPVKVGDAKVAYACALTKAVLAAFVELSLVAAVGIVTVPVKVGEASGA